MRRARAVTRAFLAGRFPGPLLGALLGLWAASAPAADDANLRLVVTNVKVDAGKLIAWVYQSDEDWLRERGARSQKAVPVKGNRQGDTVTVDFLLPPGDYAVLLFHDVNDDGKLASNFLGLPKEPTAITNNVRPRFGPPRYQAALVKVGDTTVVQRLKLQ